MISVRQLRKSYGSFAALQGIDLSVEPGEILGLLGPNGAGKTTLISVLSCLTDADSGTVTFEDRPLLRDDREQRRLIGIGTQDLAVYADMTARENIRFFGRLYGLTGGDLERRIDEILDLTALRDKADERAGTYSGGMKRRLNLGVAVVHRPRILYLDEPTTGVDPQSRNHIFEEVRRLNREGMTIVYTSHYMEEVQALCPRIAIMDHGRVIACDKLPALLRTVDGMITLRTGLPPERLRTSLADIPGVTRTDLVDGGSVRVACTDPPAVLVAIVSRLRDLQADLTAVEIREPNLEQVFLHLTERTLRD